MNFLLTNAAYWTHTVKILQNIFCPFTILSICLDFSCGNPRSIFFVRRYSLSHDMLVITVFQYRFDTTDFIYQLTHELPKNLRLKNLRKLIV